MKLKNWYIVGSVTLFLLAGFLLTWLVYPKNLVRYPFFIALLLLDFYLWTKVRFRIFTYNKVLKYIVVAIYWSPLIALSLSMLANIIVPQSNWNQLFRIYLFGGIFAIYIGKIILEVLLLISDIIQFVIRLLRNIFYFKKLGLNQPSQDTKLINRRKFLGDTVLATGGLIIGTMFTGMFKWVHQFRIREIDVRLKGLKSNVFDGYRIVQLSDIHLGGWAEESALEQAIEDVNNLNPDLVVFTGDLVNYRTDEAFRFKNILSKLKAKDGIVAILGNHDYGDYLNWPSRAAKQENMNQLFDFYNEISWKLLRNEHLILSRETERIAIIGVENWSKNNRFPRYGDILKASKGIGQVQGKILLSHDPSHWNAVVTQKHKDIDLMLAGHTHGFQFGIEIPGIKWSPAQYLYEEWAGLYTNPDTNQKLYVNRGLGSIGYPGRIGILPEITLINLKA
jgi:predicted MPP superfamily phosphohydrolase